MKPHHVLTEAAGLIGERGKDYGGIEDNFANIAAIANAATGLDLSPFHVAVIMAAVKFARVRQSPGKADNYLDGINYLAFAHELRPSPTIFLDLTDEEVAETEVEEFKRAFGFA